MDIRSAEEAAAFTGLQPGTTVFLKVDIGDHYEGRSVRIPRNLEGVVNGYHLDPVDGHYWKMVVDLINSPGRTFLTADLRDVHTFYSEHRMPDPPKVPTRYDRLLADDDL
jgi:hypothetical protein